MPVNPTRSSGNNNLVQIFTWNLTSANPDGTPIGEIDLSDRSVQVYGDLGGGDVVWQGTSHPSQQEWVSLSSTGGTSASFSEPGIKQILESTLFARPLLVGSTGGNVTVVAIGRKPSRG